MMSPLFQWKHELNPKIIFQCCNQYTILLAQSLWSTVHKYILQTSQNTCVTFDITIALHMTYNDETNILCAVSYIVHISDMFLHHSQLPYNTDYSMFVVHSTVVCIWFKTRSNTQVHYTLGTMLEFSCPCISCSLMRFLCKHKLSNTFLLQTNTENVSPIRRESVLVGERPGLLEAIIGAVNACAS